eukprot:1475105-Pyramimonas_sp.AAC.1
MLCKVTTNILLQRRHTMPREKKKEREDEEKRKRRTCMMSKVMIHSVPIARKSIKHAWLQSYK